MLNRKDNLTSKLNESDIFALVEQVRKTAGKNIGVDYIKPSDGMCFLIGSPIAEGLKNKQLDVEQLVYVEGQIKHTFIKLKVKNTDQFFLLDHSYQQFTEENERLGLPDIILQPIKNENKLIRMLLNHRIPRKYHKIWLSRLF